MSKLSQEEKARIAQDAQQGRDIARANYPEISDERYATVLAQVQSYERGGALPAPEDQELFNHLLYDPYRQTQEVYNQLNAGHKVSVWKPYDNEILDAMTGGKGLYVINEGDDYSYISLTEPDLTLNHVPKAPEPVVQPEIQTASTPPAMGVEYCEPTSDEYVEPYLDKILSYLEDEDLGRFTGEYITQIRTVNKQAEQNCIPIEETKGYEKLIELKSKHEELLYTNFEYAAAFEEAERDRNQRSHDLQEMIKKDADEAVQTISEGLSKLSNSRIPVSKYTGELLDAWRENGSLTVEDLLTFVENDPYEAEKSILAILRALDPSQQNVPSNTASEREPVQQTATSSTPSNTASEREPVQQTATTPPKP